MRDAWEALLFALACVGSGMVLAWLTVWRSGL